MSYTVTCILMVFIYKVIDAFDLANVKQNIFSRHNMCTARQDCITH